MRSMRVRLNAELGDDSVTGKPDKKETWKRDKRESNQNLETKLYGNKEKVQEQNQKKDFGEGYWRKEQQICTHEWTETIDEEKNERHKWRNKLKEIPLGFEDMLESGSSFDMIMVWVKRLLRCKDSPNNGFSLFNAGVARNVIEKSFWPMDRVEEDDQIAFEYLRTAIGTDRRICIVQSLVISSDNVVLAFINDDFGFVQIVSVSIEGKATASINPTFVSVETDSRVKGFLFRQGLIVAKIEAKRCCVSL
ncbi:hypothetical protein F5880DRAFT_1503786 [Lentinula raphanica]|nr:hypothetical protein F5880DRAFT_1503786 [Lentinula raphanica]